MTSKDKIKDTVILKCETQKAYKDLPAKSHVWDLLLSVASTYSYVEDRYMFWTYTKKDELKQYLDGKHVVGFNCTSFDLPLIYGKRFTCDPTYIIQTLISKDENTGVSSYNTIGVCTDIYFKMMEQIYKVTTYDAVKDRLFRNPVSNKSAYSLYNVYVSTIGKAIPLKTLGINGNELFASKNILALVEFNMFKIRLIKQLYEYILRHHYIINGEFDVLRMDNVKSPKAVTFEDFLPF